MEFRAENSPIVDIHEEMLLSGSGVLEPEESNNDTTSVHLRCVHVNLFVKPLVGCSALVLCVHFSLSSALGSCTVSCYPSLKIRCSDAKLPNIPAAMDEIAESNAKHLLQRDIGVARFVVPTQRDCIHLLITNFPNKPQELVQGTVIAHVDEIADTSKAPTLSVAHKCGKVEVLHNDDDVNPSLLINVTEHSTYSPGMRTP